MILTASSDCQKQKITMALAVSEDYHNNKVLMILKGSAESEKITMALRVTENCHSI